MADCTQQYTDCGEIDDLYECAKLLIANSKLFRDWTNGDEDTTVILGGKPFPSLRAIIQNVNRLANIATLENPGAAMPDGITTTVDGLGKISALGGNLRLNDEIIITESGEWEVPVTGWYDVLIIGGGNGGVCLLGYNGTWMTSGGYAAARNRKLFYFEKGAKIPVVIGVGGQGGNAATTTNQMYSGGITKFGDVLSNGGGAWEENAGSNSIAFPSNNSGFNALYSFGCGPGGGRATYTPLNPAVAGWQYNSNCEGYYWGGGGAAYINKSGFGCSGNGKQGAVILRFWNPAKVGGPAPTPALFMARAAARVATQPAVVNLYDPETGQGSVWREEDAPAKLAEGLITQEAWQEICAARAAEERAAWLASPDTEAERFEMLRMACEAKLTETDKLVQPDYPLTEESRAEIVAYRQAIRDLNHQPGAPWDGGGELTPWPALPAIEKAE